MGLGPELVDLTWLGIGILIFIIAVIILKGIRIIRPTTRAAVETLGKYTRFQKSGITYIIPIFQRMFSINITEQLVDVTRQEELKSALYKVNNYQRQIVQLARTTLRNVIGDNDFKTVNSQRGKLNFEVFTTMEKETAHWGINIVRVELKEIEPPKDVQDTMNMVIKAENDKQAAIDFANATETKAEGDKRARIQTAKGIKESQILEAEGEAKAIVTVAEAKAKQIELVNSAADKYFKGNAQLLEKLQVTRDSLDKNSKIILTKDGISPTLVINESDSTVIPTRKKQETQEKAE